MIIVCEPIRWNLEHIPCNAGILAAIRVAYPGMPLHFYGEELHVRNLQRELGNEMSSSIVWKIIHIPPRHSDVFYRFWQDLTLVREISNRCQGYAEGHIVMMSANASILVGLKLLMKTRHLRNRVQVILHGELASLTWIPRNPCIRLRTVRTALQIGSNHNIQYIVLEEAIRRTLAKEIPSLDGHVGVLDHPVALAEAPSTIDRISNPVRFGLLGLATQQKGFSTFLKVAAQSAAMYGKRAEFHAIGTLHDDFRGVDSLEMGALTSRPGHAFMSRNEFARRVAQLHFVCLFFEGRYYDFSPSGVLLDAIAWEKPMIASRVGIIEDLADRYGDIGYLYGDETDISGAIEKIMSEMDQVRYDRQKAAIRKAKISRSPESLARSYRALCEEQVRRV